MWHPCDTPSSGILWQTRTIMRPALGWSLLIFTLFHSASGSNLENFSESLKITPLADGRVATTFSFEIVLNGTFPRDPRSLTSRDACTLPCLIISTCRVIQTLSTALCLLPFDFGSNIARIRSDRTPSFSQCRQLGLRALGISWSQWSGNWRRAMGLDGNWRAWEASIDLNLLIRSIDRLKV